MPVVSNSSPLITLSEVGQLDLLIRLYGQVAIPDAVYSEVVRAGAERAGAAEVAAEQHIVIRSVTNTEMTDELRKVLGSGEAEAITLAVELNADTLIIDDAKARRVAQRQGLDVSGVLGVLFEAKQAGLLDAIGPVLDDLITRGRYRISQSLYQEALRRAGE